MNADAAATLVSLVVGVFGGALGAYVGMRVGLARLETWKLMAAENLKNLDKAVGLLKEDSLVHDMEIESLMGHANMVRVRRQRTRD